MAKNVRTGIDLGSCAVKLLRGDGGASLQRLTHAGIETWAPGETGDQVAPAAAALERLVRRLGLSRRSLGRIAVAAVDDDVALREVVVPAMPEDDLRRSLPFEARRHLYYEGMESPILDAQVLGVAGAVEGEVGPSMRALIVAAPQRNRDFAVAVLGAAGLEPEVVDLEPLATLNATAWLRGDRTSDPHPLALLDFGRQRTRLSISHRDGGLLTRTVGPGVPAEEDQDAVAGFSSMVASGIHETLLFYRGRYRREITRVDLSGGGALRSEMVRRIAEGAGITMQLLDPLRSGLTAESIDAETRAQGPRFTTAYGLCRWWDESDV